jgi:2-hydroxychromene-2-carboxylate isomerase
VGNVISLEDARLARAQGQGIATRSGGGRTPRVTFYFDLSSPFTYLAAERVDRLFGNLVWRPVLEEVLQVPPLPAEVAEERAHALGLPLVWPELGPASVRPAMRVASLAAEQGRAAPFVLAASRLAFCGGFELDHPEVLAEAAAAGNLGLEESLHAAGDVGRDGAMEAAARKLLAHGVDRLPALRVGRLLFAGEDRVAEAAAAVAMPAAMRAV